MNAMKDEAVYKARRADHNYIDVRQKQDSSMNATECYCASLHKVR